MAGEHLQATPGFDLPQPNGAVVRGGEGKALIRAPPDASDRVGVALEDAEATSHFHIPEADVPGAREGASLIGRPGVAVNVVGVAFKHVKAAALRQIPYSHGLVPRTGE